MLVSVVRFCKGYVDFTARGRSPERLLNLTAVRGISLWNPKPVEGGVCGSMYASDYRRIRPLAARAGVAARVERRHGLPFIVNRYKGRLGLPVGAVLGAVLIVFLSQFLWSLRIVGADNISERKIRDCLADNGITVGTRKSAVDVDKTERGMLLELDDIRWLSVNLLGCTADIEVREKAKKPDVMSLEPCNIKAKEDGVITSVKARGGFSEVKVGSGVVKGDLLVSGVKMTKLNTPSYLHADADVYADVYSERELKIPKQYDYYSLSENTAERKRMRLFGLELPVTFSFAAYDDAVFTLREESLCVNDTLLPLSLLTETERGLSRHEAAPDREQAKTVFRNAELLYEAFSRPEGTVKRRDLTVTEDEEGFSCHFSCVFNENIAEEAEFSVTEG
ncbi:MAG: sporulation protein YqfD [Ruminococcus sp.]